MHAIRRLLPAVLLMALTGCVPRSAYIIPHNYALTPGSSNGLAVFSFTANYEAVYLVLYVRNKGDRSVTAVEMRPRGVPGDWEYPAKGRLIVMELNAGEYEIYQWTGFTVRAIRPAEDFSIPFTIQDARATYIGNVHIEVGRSRFGIGILDQTRRDVPLFLSRHPLVTRESLDIRLARLRDRGERE